MITPLEVSKKQYSKSFRGYNRTEVDEYNKRVSEEMERLVNDNIELTEKYKRIKEELDKFNRIEQNIRDALIIAQKTHDQVITSGNEKADVIVREAEMRAKEIMNKASEDVINIARSHEEAKKEYVLFKTKFKNLLKTQLDTIDDIHID